MIYSELKDLPRYTTDISGISESQLNDLSKLFLNLTTSELPSEYDTNDLSIVIDTETNDVYLINGIGQFLSVDLIVYYIMDCGDIVSKYTILNYKFEDLNNSDKLLYSILTVK